MWVDTVVLHKVAKQYAADLGYEPGTLAHASRSEEYYLEAKGHIEAYEAAKDEKPVGMSPFDRVIAEPGELWPKTLRSHIEAISRNNVMVSARDVWRILDALLMLVERVPERESIDALLREIRERSFDCEIHTNDCGTTVKITHPSGKNCYKSSIEGDGDLLACIREAYAAAQRNDLDKQGRRGCVHCGGSGYVTEDIVHRVWTPSNVSSGGATVVETIPAPCRFCDARSDLAVTTRIEDEVS